MEEEPNKENLQYQILQNYTQNPDVSFKIIIIGDSGVGKSCLTIKAINNTFEQFHNTTIGFEMYKMNIKINDKIINLQIWDTCGQEIYRSLISSFYRNTSLAILMYSIDNITSFNNVCLWLKELKKQSNPDVKVFLLGNKCDLEEYRIVSINKAKNYASDNQFDYFAETSAKSGENINNIFIQAAKVLYNEYNKYDNPSTQAHLCLNYENHVIPRPRNNSKSQAKEKEQNKKGCC